MRDMVRAIRVHEAGQPAVMQLETIRVGFPGAGELRIKQRAIGVNYVDTYFRSGQYRPPSGFPFTPGNEGVGEVIAVGEGVSDVKLGDRVGYLITFGAYADERTLPASRAIPIPSRISDEIAAAALLKGMTAHYLLRRTFNVGIGHTVLVHAAAGGVGQLLCQWAAHLGATVIGTVGSDAKAKIARANGCSHTIRYDQEDFAVRVKDITGGELCDVVYDGVGKAVFPASLDCVRPLGTFVNFGNTSGLIGNFDIGLLGRKGSLFATRTSTAHYLAKRDDLLRAAGETFDVILKGAIKVDIHRRYALTGAVQAHEDLENRKTTGSLVLIP
jgi:NADPH2:quinone reductase